ncbi:MAG TPA: hypothetical protein PKL99_07225 [Syntrophales bacterium]|nr:hypothetical protein [Syntrophales bacterium]
MSEMYQKVAALISPLYEVGGSVRDALLGLEPKDFDFTTPLSPDDIEGKIRQAGKRPFLTGKRFGTVGVRMDGHLVEITTFRAERYEEGSRKPDVTFVDDLTADLSRRDFTINAMAREGERLIDPFHGRSDLALKTLRAVGAPSTRFREDPLRMLRAARFSAQLGFAVEERTFRAVTKMSHRILQVSKERWTSELDRLLLSEHVRKGLDVLMESGLCRFILPEISLQKDYGQNSKYHRFTLWEHTLRVTASVPRDIHLRWAAFLHDVAKPFVRLNREDRSTYAGHDLLGHDLVVRLGGHLRWPKERTLAVAGLVRDHLKAGSPLKRADDGAK